jgi:hypothetical protein
MKIPKKLRLFGFDWKVILGDKIEGANFDWKIKTIKISTKYKEQEKLFLHELMEDMLTEMHFRFYGQEKNMEYRFEMTHTEFCNFVNAFYQALKDNKLF